MLSPPSFHRPAPLLPSACRTSSWAGTTVSFAQPRTPFQTGCFPRTSQDLPKLTSQPRSKLPEGRELERLLLPAPKGPRPPPWRGWEQEAKLEAGWARQAPLPLLLDRLGRTRQDQEDNGPHLTRVNEVCFPWLPHRALPSCFPRTQIMTQEGCKPGQGCANWLCPLHKPPRCSTSPR